MEKATKHRISALKAVLTKTRKQRITCERTMQSLREREDKLLRQIETELTKAAARMASPRS